jgi:peptide/nickel transport system ATP-binding protein
MSSNNNTLLAVEDLKLYFRTGKGVVQAVDKVGFSIKPNEAVVVIGESGCGKSSFAKALLRLLPRNIYEYSGHIVMDGKDTMQLTDEEYRKEVRWVKISLVPQAAMNSLNPVLKVGDQVAEPLIVHLGLTKEEAAERATEMFKRVGVPVDFLNRYAFELSGGMRQRVAIAMALITNPELVVLDEPTSALDLLTQANIMNLLKRVKKETDASFILITHDIATSSEPRRFFEAPLHPYSQKLMASVPRLRATVEPEFITGQPPSLVTPPTGCRFAARCPKRFEKCSEEPPLFAVDDRTVKCWLYEPGKEHTH